MVGGGANRLMLEVIDGFTPGLFRDTLGGP